jgi:hypothetical protein
VAHEEDEAVKVEDRVFAVDLVEVKVHVTGEWARRGDSGVRRFRLLRENSGWRQRGCGEQQNDSRFGR